MNFSCKCNPNWCILHLIMSNKPKKEIMFEIHEQGNVPHNSLQFHRKYLLNACAVTLRSCIAERLCGWTAVAFPASLRTAAAEATGCLRNSILSRAGARTPPTLRAFRGNHSYPSPSGERSYHPPGDSSASAPHHWVGVNMRNAGGCMHSSFPIPVEDSKSCGTHSYSHLSLSQQCCISTINSPITSGTRVDPSSHSHNAMQWSWLKCTERC